MTERQAEEIVFLLTAILNRLDVLLDKEPNHE